MRSQIDFDNPTIIEVRRTNVLEDVKDIIVNDTFDFRRGIKIQFTNEAGVDSGGLSRECLRICMKHIKNLQIFEGPVFEKVLAPDTNSLQENTYRRSRIDSEEYDHMTKTNTSHNSDHLTPSTL